ncbi:MAG TPA: hypothetical protein ENJ75_00310 [Candidatus Kaiserbacteria bacterium]|nr:hypothetical protein [Candidatus Kaiserbacteria bacterium]
MIGLFDSGSGGLSVLREVHKHLPEADILYLGDIKNAPYGEKAPEKLFTLTINAIRFLQSSGASSIISACNSVSASLVVSLFDTLNLENNHLIEMVGPTVSYFRNNDESVFVCATPATVRAGLYRNGFNMIGKTFSEVVIPGLASAIEFGATDMEIERIIRNSFKGVSYNSFDTLVLGCTHYPLVTHIFERVFGDSIRIFNPAEAVANRAKERFLKTEKGNGILRFAITKDSELFRTRVAEFFPENVGTVEVVSMK